MAAFRGPLESWRNPEGDGKLLIQFYVDAVMLHKESEKEGRPIYEDREFISIRIPGDKNTEVKEELRLREGTPMDYKVRFAEQYARFKANAAEQYVGTPLDQWPQMTPQRIRMLQYHNIYTVEHMAEASDTVIQKLGIDGNPMRAAAKDYLLRAAGTDSEKEVMNAKIAELQRQIAALVSANASAPQPSAALPSDVTAAPAKRRGRPPREAVAA